MFIGIRVLCIICAALAQLSIYTHTVPLFLQDLCVTRTRSYDLSVTYDKYYQTPRLWLKGYDEVTE